MSEVGKIKTVKKKTLLGVACHKKASSARSSIGTQRAADVGPRYGESSRAGPSVIGKLVCHVKTSPVLDSKPRGARYLDRGTTRWNSRAPARQGPSPEERQPVYPQRFNWFESTPRNAPRLPIQTNNHTTSEPHTHVMSNENKFPLRKKKKKKGGCGGSPPTLKLFSSPLRRYDKSIHTPRRDGRASSHAALDLFLP